MDDSVMLVKQLPDDYSFTHDSQDVEAIKDTFIGARDYDSFFVTTGDGGCKSIYGMEGIVPYNEKKVYKVL